MNKSGVVYIVHHVDTEGPLWENIQELFHRIKIIFNIDLDPTYENLKKLQEGEINIPVQIKKELALVVDPHTVNFKKNWHEIEEMLNRIMHSDFRNKITDSFGKGWIYNWHVMDHVGFENNPRHRDMGFLNIFDFYSYIIQITNSSCDKIHWHFHPVSFFKDAHIPAVCYDNCIPLIHQIISRRLIERDWFPVVNRAGFHTVRTDSNLFLEQWIPFDPSNISVNDDLLPQYQNDMTAGRYGDWRGAPTDWSLYHPDFYDWRRAGGCKRTIARVQNLKSRHRSITVDEIKKAFEKACSGENVYLGITNHDWREMSIEIDEFREMLVAVTEKYKHVKFRFSESVEAFRNVIGYNEDKIKTQCLDFDVVIKKNILEVNVKNGELFGPQPYLAIKTMSNEFFHDNFDYHEYKKNYSYTFDEYTVSLNLLKEVCIASNDIYGNNCIVKIKFIDSSNYKIQKIINGENE